MRDPDRHNIPMGPGRDRVTPPGGYGALIACLGAGAVTGTLAATLSTKAARPAVLACACYLIEAVAIAFVPFLGGLAGAAVATFVLGGCNGLGNVIFLTLVQRWAPPRLLGRVMSVVMLAGLGSFHALGRGVGRARAPPRPGPVLPRGRRHRGRRDSRRALPGRVPRLRDR